MGRIRVLALASLFCLLISTTSNTSQTSVSAQSLSIAGSGAVTLTAEEAEVLRLVNDERVKAGLWPVAISGPLTAAARGHNADMIANRFFGHTGTDGRGPSQRARDAGFLPYGWGEAYVGENIAAGYPTAADVVRGWLDSPGHRANILKPEYREIGIGFARNPACAPYCTYWTQDFGSQPKVLPVFLNNGRDQALGASVKVTLTDEIVSSYGSVGPIREMMLSPDPTFAGAQWQPYSRQATWNLPADGKSLTVYAILRDGTGQEVRSSDSVIVVPVKGRVFIPAVTMP